MPCAKGCPSASETGLQDDAQVEDSTLLNQALQRALQIATTVHRACEDVGPGRGQPWLQQIAKAETGNEPSIRKAALVTESIAGCVRLHAMQPRAPCSASVEAQSGP